MDSGSKTPMLWLHMKRITVEPEVLDNVKPSELQLSLERHARGDWGDLPDQVKAANEHDLFRRKVVVSRFAVSSRAFICIVTDIKQARTAVFLQFMH